MLVCDGSMRWRRRDRRSRAELQFGAIVPKSRDQGDWTAVRPRKLHAEPIGCIARRVVSTYYGVV
jgi:hypothetical protein